MLGASQDGGYYIDRSGLHHAEVVDGRVQTSHLAEVPGTACAIAASDKVLFVASIVDGHLEVSRFSAGDTMSRVLGESSGTGCSMAVGRDQVVVIAAGAAVRARMTVVPADLAGMVEVTEDRCCRVVTVDGIVWLIGGDTEGATGTGMVNLEGTTPTVTIPTDGQFALQDAASAGQGIVAIGGVASPDLSVVRPVVLWMHALP